MAIDSPLPKGLTMLKLTTHRLYLKSSIIAIALVASGASLAADETKVVRLSEPVEQTVNSESFGAPLDESVPAVSLNRIASDGGAYVGQSVRVIARVAEDLGAASPAAKPARFTRLSPLLFACRAVEREQSSGDKPNV